MPPRGEGEATRDENDGRGREDIPRRTPTERGDATRDEKNVHQTTRCE